MWGPAYLLCLYSCVLWATKYNLLKSRFTAYQHGQVTLISQSYWIGHVLCLHSILLPTATSTTGCNRAFCIVFICFSAPSLNKYLLSACCVLDTRCAQWEFSNEWNSPCPWDLPAQKKKKTGSWKVTTQGWIYLLSLPHSFFFPFCSKLCLSMDNMGVSIILCLMSWFSWQTLR